MIYGYEYDFSVPAFGEGLAVGAAGVALAILLIFLLVMLAISIVSYVLGSVGFYRIAKRRGIHHAWLAWVPVGNGWLLGSISDHYQYVAKHKVTKRRTVLLILQLIDLIFDLTGGSSPNGGGDNAQNQTQYHHCPKNSGNNGYQ